MNQTSFSTVVVDQVVNSVLPNATKVEAPSHSILGSILHLNSKIGKGFFFYLSNYIYFFTENIFHMGRLFTTVGFDIKRGSATAFHLLVKRDFNGIFQGFRQFLDYFHVEFLFALLFAGIVLVSLLSISDRNPNGKIELLVSNEFGKKNSETEMVFSLRFFFFLFLSFLSNSHQSMLISLVLSPP
jgi:hypothetical protein